MKTNIGLLVGVIALSGCAGSKFTMITPARALAAPISTVALAPSGGPLADAVGVSLLNYGVRIFDTQQTSNLLIRSNLNEEEVMEPQNLALIAARGIDAILFVRTVAGYDDKPQSASIRLVHTEDGLLVGGLAWQNGKGGVAGSPLDRMQRKDIVDAGEEIAEALAEQMRWERAPQ